MRHNAKVSSLAISSEESPQVQVLVHADCLACCCCYCILCDKGNAFGDMHEAFQLPLSMRCVQDALPTSLFKSLLAM